MPIVTLSDTTDAKLKLLVTDPFEDTRMSILESLIDAELERRGITPNGSRRNPGPQAASASHAAALQASLETLNPDRPGALAHTRLLSATVMPG